MIKTIVHEEKSKKEAANKWPCKMHRNSANKSDIN